MRIVTDRGAQVRVSPAPEWIDSGKGVMLTITMEDPRDTRECEIYLDPFSAAALSAAVLEFDR